MHHVLPLHERFIPKSKTKKQQLFKSRVDKAFSRTKRWHIAPRLVFIACVFMTLYRCLLYSPAKPKYEVNDNITVFDLNSVHANGGAGERMLLCIPLRNAEDVLRMTFEHLYNLTYPHSLIDVAFLVSDSSDDTDSRLASLLQEATTMWDEDKRFGTFEVYRRNFGAKIGQDVDARHGVAVQGVRRKLMGRARNWLLSVALKPHHSWVYWRDADILTSPPDIIEHLMSFKRDIIVPNVWRPLPKFLGGQQPYDLNSWVESQAALDLAATLDEDDVIVEGYAEYPTYRVHLAYLRQEDGAGNPQEIIDLDGIGGVSILSRAKVFRAGCNFPGFAFENHAETEGFGKMARKMGFSVGGLVHYTVFHLYEPSEDDLKKMAELAEKGLPVD